jgi:hypothetical protein
MYTVFNEQKVIFNIFPKWIGSLTLLKNVNKKSSFNVDYFYDLQYFILSIRLEIGPSEHPPQHSLHLGYVLPIEQGSRAFHYLQAIFGYLEMNQPWSAWLHIRPLASKPSQLNIFQQKKTELWLCFNNKMNFFVCFSLEKYFFKIF